MIDSQILSGYHEALVPYSEWLFCPALMSGAFISFAKKSQSTSNRYNWGIRNSSCESGQCYRKFNIFIFLKKICLNPEVMDMNQMDQFYKEVYELLPYKHDKDLDYRKRLSNALEEYK